MSDLASSLFGSREEAIFLEARCNQGEPDVIARESCYHRSCYINHTHQKSLQGIYEANVCEESGGERVFLRTFQLLYFSET